MFSREDKVLGDRIMNENILKFIINISIIKFLLYLVLIFMFLVMIFWCGGLIDFICILTIIMHNVLTVNFFDITY